MLTWPLNAQHAASPKDITSNDFIAILFYTAVTAGHVFVQVAQHGNFRDGKKSGDATLSAHAASIYGSARVCTLFLGLLGVFFFRFPSTENPASNHSLII